LPPIELSSESAEKWGIPNLSRYVGKGASLSPNSKVTKFVEGQLIMFDNHFSFVWLPSRQHVFFGRPSPEVVIRLLRDTISKEDEIDNMRQHLEVCLELDWTTSIARTLSDIGDQSFRRISRKEDIKQMHEESASSKQIGFSQVFNVQKWKDYLDNVLNRDAKGENNN
jgi:Cyclin D1 binding domain